MLPRLVTALASWSRAIDISEAGRSDVMAKHMEKSLGILGMAASACIKKTVQRADAQRAAFQPYQGRCGPVAF